MFQFGGFPTYTYVFSIRSLILHQGGFPIRKSTVITLISSSPWLIAACHVLHRLLMPRHSPYALLSLNFFCRIWSQIRSSVLSLLELLCITYYSYLCFRLAKLCFFTQFRKDQFLVLSLLFFVPVRVLWILYSVFNDHCDLSHLNLTSYQVLHKLNLLVEFM